MWSGLDVLEKEKSLASAGIQTPDHPTHNLVTTLTMLLQCLVEIKTADYRNYIFFLLEIENYVLSYIVIKS